MSLQSFLESIFDISAVQVLDSKLEFIVMIARNPFTNIIIGLIIGLVLYLFIKHLAQKKGLISSDSNNKNKDLTYQNLHFKTRPLSFLYILANVSFMIPSRWKLDYIKLQNGTIEIANYKGEKLQGDINRVQINYSTDMYGRIFYTVLYEEQKISFFQLHGMLEDEEWKNIFDVLNPKKNGFEKHNDFLRIFDTLKDLVK